jgi:Sec-independent protein translocase protein TatA
LGGSPSDKQLAENVRSAALRLKESMGDEDDTDSDEEEDEEEEEVEQKQQAENDAEKGPTESSGPADENPVTAQTA